MVRQLVSLLLVGFAGLASAKEKCLGKQCAAKEGDMADSMSVLQTVERRVVYRHNLGDAKETTPACEIPPSRQKCMQAASAHGYTWDGTRNWADRSPGCLRTKADNHVNWNNNNAGVSQNDAQTAFCTPPVEGACAGLYMGTPPEDHEAIPDSADYDKALEALDLEAVKADMVKLLTNSQECWPADYGNYGPFFVRLAWHCAGTYRATDGEGGCGGGRNRFEPERSWDDNTNLDKARALLTPIKQKYGIGLSWGDLFVLAGTTAIRSMGAPIERFCAGRIDDGDGEKSRVALGPSEEQQLAAPCTGGQGNCQEDNSTKLATVQVGLIYVDPQGPGGNPDPAASAKDIRITFGKMTANNDRSTVALIGGGHAFGKTHGACAKGHEFDHGGAGFSPNEVFEGGKEVIPWHGKCGTGMGKDTYTSGFEGAWTSTPTKWSNEFFTYLLDYEWEKHKEASGGLWQWRLKENPTDERIRLTSDIALLHDAEYLKIVKEFAANQTALDEAFDSAWTVLTENGGTWSPNKKCDSMASMLDMDITDA